MTQATFEKRYPHWNDRPKELGSASVDAKVLANAPFIIVTDRFSGPEVYCVDQSTYRKAKNAASREKARLLREAREERAKRLRVKANAAKQVEPWMLAELLARRPDDNAIQEAAKDLEMEIQKPKGAQYGWLDKAIRKLPEAQLQLLVIGLAIRAKAHELHTYQLSSAAEGKVRKKFAPGMAALKKRILEAAGVKDEKPKRGRSRARDVDEETDDIDDLVDAGEPLEDVDDELDGPQPAMDATDAVHALHTNTVAECVVCSCTDLEACEGGCSWLVVDREKRVGVCSSCAPNKKQAIKMLKETVAA
jgi:hypothetical protein